MENREKQELNKLGEFFLVIECGYEGIEGLLYATSSPEDAVDRIQNLRSRIEDARKRRKEILGEHGEEEDENFEDYYDRMLSSGKIKWEEFSLAKYKSPDSYCIQKWNGREFSCVCKELKCEPSETWLM